ncbi:hypothetical protein CLOP_g11328 [Closterium sp. NIES-67]|nr:hypothetical protein CLOP_g11328 [Closterium sp. NIES-67]
MRRLRRSSLNCPPTWAPAAVAAAAVAAVSRQRMAWRERRRGQHAAVLPLAWCLAALAASPLATMVNAVPFDASQVQFLQVCQWVWGHTFHGWSATNPNCSTATRIKCDSSGMIVEIDMTSYRLAGSIPAAISSLANLRSLDLGACQLNESIPAEIGSLTNLEYL